MRIAGEPTDKAAAEDRQKGGRKVVENSSKDPPPNPTAISPNLWKLCKTLGFPHRKTNIPQACASRNRCLQWLSVGFPPIPQPLLRLFDLVLKTFKSR